MNKMYTLIIGASSGIGYALAEEFAKKHHLYKRGNIYEY